MMHLPFLSSLFTIVILALGAPLLACASKSLGKGTVSVNLAQKQNIFLQVEVCEDPRSGAVHLNKMTSLMVQVAAPQHADLLPGLQISFDARMPAHNHGMIVKPRIIKLSAGVFRVEGVKLHMPGEWEFIVTVMGDGIASAKIPMKI